MTQLMSANGEANNKNVGGTHYIAHGRTDVQHWDLVHQYNLGYFEGCSTKYVMRWRNKNGLTDLEKGLHYLEKLIELSEGYRVGATTGGTNYPWRLIEVFKLDFFQGYFVLLLMNWRSAGGLSDLYKAHQCLKAYIDSAAGELKPTQHTDAASATRAPIGAHAAPQKT